MPDISSILGLLGGSAGTGALASSLGKSGKWKQLSTMTPQQQQLGNWAGLQGQQQIQNPYQGFDPIAQRATSQFNQQTVPGLAERFTSMGSSGGGALSSPAFASQLGESGAGLSEALAALQAQYGLQQQGLGQSLLGLGQQQQFENYYQPGGHSFLSSLFGGLSGGLGQLGLGAASRRYAQPNPQDNLSKILAMLGGQ